MTTSKSFGAFIIVISANAYISFQKCNSTLNRKMQIENCKVIISSISIPDDFERLSNINYICEKSHLSKAAEKKKLHLNLRFNDKNYTLFNFDSRTRLLHDKINDVIFCFKQSTDYNLLSKESVRKIYIIDKNLMPLYSLELIEKGLIIMKWFYYNEKKSPIVNRLKLKEENMSIQQYFDYPKLVEITKLLNTKKYIQTNECYQEDPHFKTMPYWVDYM